MFYFYQFCVKNCFYSCVEAVRLVVPVAQRLERISEEIASTGQGILTRLQFLHRPLSQVVTVVDPVQCDCADRDPRPGVQPHRLPSPLPRPPPQPGLREGCLFSFSYSLLHTTILRFSAAFLFGWWMTMDLSWTFFTTLM